jgi:hypothetical protein
MSNSDSSSDLLERRGKGLKGFQSSNCFSNANDFVRPLEKEQTPVKLFTIQTRLHRWRETCAEFITRGSNHLRLNSHTSGQCCWPTYAAGSATHPCW